MGTQHRITESVELLDDNGLLTNPGYATRPFWRYDRNRIKAGWHRIKEWDYYSILAPDKGYGLTLTLSDLGYIGLIAVCWIDFKKRTHTQLDTMAILPKGRTNLPPGSEDGSVAFEDKKIKMKFDVSGTRRSIVVEAPDFVDEEGKKGLKGEIVLHQDPDMDSMVIATSWEENRRAFYYNHKINCMPAEGVVAIGDRTYEFAPDTCFGALDWGRGNWTYKNRWFWGSASGLVDGESVGWNIGYGFSDRTPASENMVFYRGKAHKLDDVTFQMNTDDYMEPWKFTSNDGRFEMEMAPLVDRQADTNLLLIKSIQHQVFGLFKGHVVLDDGTKLQVKDFLGFAEDVLNWW
ncbi:MAG: DUF2804 domain-containing protein [Proteobacteria bacterium]|nr:DUF2804 domain-containing protein [Pseudomonadota bacterium]